MEVSRFLDLYAPADSFDLVLADPPYLKDLESGDLNLADMILAHPKLPSTLAPGGLLVLECERRQPLPSLPVWEIRSDRCYGESRILILGVP
jgi:16S rRNA G966 N2-methylase RsmD